MATMVAIATVSCTKTDETPDQTGKKEISFKHNYFTKAAVDESGSFMVTAYNKGEDYSVAAIEDEAYNVSTGFEAPKYYDGVSDYEFFGYAAASGTALSSKVPEGLAVAGTEKPTLVFTTPANADVDLVVATAIAEAPEYPSTSLPFKHALSKVGFKFSKSPAGGSNYIVTKVDFKVGNDAAVVSFGGTSTKSGKSATYTLSGTYSAITDVATAVGTPFYVVPQTLATTDNIVVTYTVDGGAEQTKTFTVTTVLAAGKGYNYTFAFTQKEITLTATVENDWSDTEPEL